MKVQDYMIGVTTEAMNEAFRYARATPPDKLDWKPMDEGQSVLSMCRELAKCPDWALQILKAGGMQMDGDDTSGAEMGSWVTLDDCETACKAKLAAYFAYLADYPDDQLAGSMDLPFGPGGSMKTFTIPEVMDYPRWNATYHLGQIGYIQTLYGDKSMY